VVYDTPVYGSFPPSPAPQVVVCLVDPSKGERAVIALHALCPKTLLFTFKQLPFSTPNNRLCDYIYLLQVLRVTKDFVVFKA
jgi:hypothetical protein